MMETTNHETSVETRCLENDGEMSSEAGSVRAMKVLACGDVRGRFSAWLKRLESVCSKAGPFDLAVCVGSFVAASDGHSEVDQAAWRDLMAGKRRLPLPVYVLGPNSQAEVSQFRNVSGYEMCENLIYLGQNGVYVTREGLRLAYFSGVAEDKEGQAPFRFSYAQFKEMQVRLRWDEVDYQGVDLLLTSQWPQGVSAKTSSKPDGVDARDIGSTLISKLALLSQPRYHFAGLHDCHYERQPYRNHEVMVQQNRHVTRFIGLASVGNAKKGKWLYAFSIAPLKLMDRRELAAQPPDATDSPFGAEELAGVGEERPHSQFFYDMSAGPEQGNDRRGHKRGQRGRGRGDFDGGGGEAKRPRQPAGPCWFCLSSNDVEKHLVVSVGDHSYLALPKGGLTSYHVLVLPIACFPSSLDCSAEVLAEMDKFKEALRKCFKKKDKSVVFFERNYK